MEPYGDDDRTVRRGPGWGGPPPPVPPAAPPRNWMWLVIAATVVIVIVSVVIVAVTASGGDEATTTAATSSTSQRPSTTKASVPRPSTSSTPQPLPPPPPPGPIGADALPGLLLTGAEAGTVFQVANTEEGSVKYDLIGGTSPIPLECRSVWAPAHKETYDPTGFTALARKNIRDEPADRSWLVEAVVSFADDAAATAAVDRVVAAWNQCKSTEFTEKFFDRDIDWRSGVVGDTDGVHTMLIFSRSQLDSPQTSTDPNCQRAIAAQRNVVVDVLACNRDLGSEGYSMARDVLAKIAATP